jgi:hypothetical protein
MYVKNTNTVIMWNFEVTSGKFEVENSIWEIYAEK